MARHRGTMILVFGILGFLGILPLAPIAWWMGTKDSLKMQDGTMDPTGKTATEIGRFLGMFTTCVLLVWVLGFAFLRIVRG